jgi:hypothetical protein
MAGSIQHCLVALSLGLSAIATPAGASTITYNWSGIVDNVDPGHHGVAIGEKIKISLTLNGAVPDTAAQPEIGRYDGTVFDPPFLVLAVDIGGTTALGSFHDVTVFNNFNGVDAFSVDVNSPMIGNVFSIDFGTSNLGVLTSDALPLSINPDNFETATFRVYGEGPPGFSGTIVSSVPGIVPLPGSVGMLVSALAGLAGLGWYKVAISERPLLEPDTKDRDAALNAIDAAWGKWRARRDSNS